MNSNTSIWSAGSRIILAAILTVALAAGTASAIGGGHGGGGGHFGGGSHFGGRSFGGGHAFGAFPHAHGFSHFGHRGFHHGGTVILPYLYPYGVYDPYDPYFYARCNPYSVYYDPRYCY